MITHVMIAPTTSKQQSVRVRHETRYRSQGLYALRQAYPDPGGGQGAVLVVFPADEATEDPVVGGRGGHATGDTGGGYHEVQGGDLMFVEKHGTG